MAVKRFPCKLLSWKQEKRSGKSHSEARLLTIFASSGNELNPNCSESDPSFHYLRFSCARHDENNLDGVIKATVFEETEEQDHLEFR